MRSGLRPLSGYALLELPSMEVAIAECTRYAEILGGTLEVDIRPLAGVG